MTTPGPFTADATAGKARYRRGVASRERILDTALQAFGSKGFQAVSTREIAQGAQVNLPAIQYYFDHKEGLYRACAAHIVGHYHAATLPAALAAQGALVAGDPALCSEHLRAVLTALARFLMTSADSRGWSLFIQRELADPGAAFDLLFDQLWRPGVELVAQLLSTARGEPCTDLARLEAIHIISGVTAFASGHSAIDRLLISPMAPALIATALTGMIERQIAGALDRLSMAD